MFNIYQTAAVCRVCAKTRLYFASVAAKSVADREQPIFNVIRPFPCTSKACTDGYRVVVSWQNYARTMSNRRDHPPRGGLRAIRGRAVVCGAQRVEYHWRRSRTYVATIIKKVYCTYWDTKKKKKNKEVIFLIMWVGENCRTKKIIN